MVTNISFLQVQTNPFDLNDSMPWIVALIIGVLSALVSYIAVQKQIKKSVLSGNRQEWINELRVLVSDFLALTNQFALINYKILSNSAGDTVLYDETTDERSVKLRAVAFKIELMMNPTEYNSETLIKLLAKLRKLSKKNIITDGKFAQDYNDCQKQIVELTQKILKTEWERVKKGE